MGDISKTTFYGALNTLLSTSSAHGLPNIHRSKSILAKLVWTLLFFSSVTYMIIQVFFLVETYFKYGYTVSLDVKFNRSLDFPAVTICNSNPVLQSKLANAADEFRELFDVGYAPPPHDGGNPPPTTQKQETTTASADKPVETNSATVSSVRGWNDREEDDGFFEKRDDDYLKEQKLIMTLANFTEDKRKKMGHDIKNMLLDCQWKGYPCSPSNFSSFFHYKYGNCYTFNNLMNTSLHTERSGPLYGLSVRLFLEQDEYMPEITESAGFRVVVHDRKTMPFPEDDGISVSPGSQTSVAVHVVSIARLGHPYGNCTDNDVDSTQFPNIFKDVYGVSYSLKACERSCYQIKVIETCTCFDPHYPKPPSSSVYPCDIEDDTAEDCMTSLVEQYRNGTLGCDCYQPCSETSYITSISSSVWPAKQYEGKLQKDIIDRNEEVRTNLNKTEPGSWVKENVAKVEVFFQEFNYENIVQSPAYTDLDLISDIGGQLGLWLGLSILTVCEIVEHAGLFIAVCFHKLFGREKNNKPQKKIKIFPVNNQGLSLENI